MMFLSILIKFLTVLLWIDLNEFLYSEADTVYGSWSVSDGKVHLGDIDNDFKPDSVLSIVYFYETYLRRFVNNGSTSKTRRLFSVSDRGKDVWLWTFFKIGFS